MSGQALEPSITGSPVTLYWINALADQEGDFVFATLKFKVSDNVLPGEYSITLSYDEDNVCNVSEINVPFDIVNGTVTVE